MSLSRIFYFYRLLCLFIFNPLSYQSSSALVDLEYEMSDSFVISSKRVIVSDYPLAFNPSLITWKGKHLLSFRIIPNRLDSFTSYIGLTWLDKEFNPVGKAQLLTLRKKEDRGVIPSRVEDGRLIQVAEKLYLVYSDNVDKKISRAGFRMYIAEIQWDGTNFLVARQEGITEFAGNRSDAREKNWVPFEYKKQLHLGYSIFPHCIVHPKFGTKSCTVLYNTETKSDWIWGDIRGGTGASLLQEEKEYLSFFHSSTTMATTHSQGKNELHYFMGAYTFSSQPPFSLKRISKKPIVGQSYYHGAIYKPYWKPVHCVFPCGFVYNTNFIWIAYGRDDHEMWITTLDRKGLLDSLTLCGKNIKE